MLPLFCCFARAILELFGKSFSKCPPVTEDSEKKEAEDEAIASTSSKRKRSTALKSTKKKMRMEDGSDEASNNAKPETLSVDPVVLEENERRANSMKTELLKKIRELGKRLPKNT